MNRPLNAAWHLELRKLVRARVTQVATAAGLGLVVLTTIGGYAAARSSPDTEMGAKAASMVAAPGWAGYTGLAATSLGITTLLCAGIVMAWVSGREFTDQTVVGLFAIPPGRATIALAKVLVVLGWVLLVALLAAALVVGGGLALGLPVSGAPGAAGRLILVGGLLGAAALPVMWVSTLGRGYLAGIAATLALVVVTNVAAGFGLGGWIPWAVPVLWSSPGSGVPAVRLLLPAGVALAGGAATCWSWRRLRLGAS